MLAVKALLAGGLVAQARPLVDELAELLTAARGPSAAVISLAARRGRGGIE